MNIRSSATAAGMCAIVLATALGASPGQAQAYGYVGHAGAFRGGYGGYGYRGYGYGYRGYGYGYRGYGYYGGWGWGGLGYGLFFASLPLYYSTFWWGGVPYYYSAGDYYLWNGAAGRYVTVPPPPGMEGQAGGQQPGGPGGQAPGATELFAYPKNNQSAEQQASDRYECHRWAKDQTGFDPTQPGSVAAPDAAKPGVSTAAQPRPASPGQRQDYLRAQTACLEGRGYSVR
jgi:hypothetical protein